LGDGNGRNESSHRALLHRLRNISLKKFEMMEINRGVSIRLEGTDSQTYFSAQMNPYFSATTNPMFRQA
jgi:hypothetical protein